MTPSPVCRSLKELRLFAKDWTAPKESYVPSNSVEECLSRILQLQHPKQQESFKEAKARPEYCRWRRRV